MVYLGGKAQNCNIELHDVRFVVGESIEDTYSQLKQQWFGELKGLHIDSYKEITGVSGFTVNIIDNPESTTRDSAEYALYFVNLGGYQPNNIAELHQFGLFAAKNAQEAKAKALASLLTNAELQHKDNLHSVDDCINLSVIDNYAIVLTPSELEYNLAPDWFGYQLL